jgi:penicillin-binding protein 1C
MVDRGWIAAADAERAAIEPVVLASTTRSIRARHVVDAVLSRPTNTPVVRTTLDPSLQGRLEGIVRSHLATLRERDVDQAGLVVIDNASGEVRAMVGSRRYEESSVNGAVNVTTALRAPGSTLKPFVYALALQAGAAPSTAVLDVPIDLGDYRPRSNDGSHFGAVSFREALGSSLNVPAVRVARDVGPEAIASLLGRLGVSSSEQEHGLSIALGGISVRLVDLANAYATLARGGSFVPWTLFAGEPPPPAQAIDRTTAYLVTDMLSDSIARRRAFGSVPRTVS